MPAHLEIPPAWRQLSADLRRTVGDSTYDIWLGSIEFHGWDGTVLTLQAPAGTQSWIANRFGRVIERCARTSFGEGVQIAYTTAAAPDRLSTPAAEQPERHEPARLIPRYTFDQFIIGDGNRLAHAAALAVAENPAQAYNPLFLHAPPGLGKTHLLHAIGNYITAFDPTMIVRYTTVEAFTNGFINALHTKSLDRFKHIYRDVDVLLIDDVQFLASKARTEEEFFHTFNALHDSGRQLVLTCDRLPRQLVGVEERLRARFEAGLVAPVAPPDRLTRIAILRKRAAVDHLQIPDQSVLELIADRVTDNIRALEGALIQVVAHHSLAGGALDARLAARVLNDTHPAVDAPSDELTTTRIQEVVAGHFRITVEELISAGRTARVAWARQLAIQLARELTAAPLQSIGADFGGRNHATVLHACKRVADRVLNSSEDAAELESLRAVLSARDDRAS